MRKEWIFFISKKLTRLSLLLLVVSFVAFTLVYLSPIDPIRAYIGADMMVISPEQREAVEAYWGINDSFVQQYASWFHSLIQGDLGTSVLHRSSVTGVIGERVGASILLMGTAWLIAGVAGFLVGSYAGMKEGSSIDKLIQFTCYFLTAIPGFWLGMLLIVVFAVWLGVFPAGLGAPAGISQENASIGELLLHFILPVMTLSILGLARVALHTREKVKSIMRSDYVRFQKGRGLNLWQIYWRHIMRNASLPLISLHFASFGELFGGTILIEQVFSYPGLGQATVNAGLSGDVPLLLGIVLFSTLLVFAGNLMADVFYKVVDPRLRRGSSI